MSKPKHTPGPWTLEAGRNFITSSGEFYLTYGQDKYKNPKFRDFCELDANARLIATAPELLEALELLARIHGFYSGPECQQLECECYVCLKARAAIAKAKGE